MKTSLRLLTFVSLFLLLVNSVSADDLKNLSINGKAVPEVVATVNGVDLPSQFLENQVVTFRVRREQQGLATSPADEEAFAREALSRLVDQELLLQQHKDLGLKINQEKVNKEIERIAGEFPSKELFLNALSVQRLDLAMLKQSISKKFIADEFLRKKIAPKVTVEKDLVKKYYEDNASDFQKPVRYKIKHIFVSAIESGKGVSADAGPEVARKAELLQKLIQQDAKDKIEMIYGKLGAGRNFEDVAKEFSEDTASKDRGGLLGNVEPETVFPEMAVWLTKLKAGEYSEPIRTSMGYHIMKVDSIQPESTVPFKDIETDIMNHLLRIKMEKARDQQLAKMRKSADIKLFF